MTSRFLNTCPPDELACINLADPESRAIAAAALGDSGLVATATSRITPQTGAVDGGSPDNGNSVVLNSTSPIDQARGSALVDLVAQLVGEIRALQADLGILAATPVGFDLPKLMEDLSAYAFILETQVSPAVGRGDLAKARTLIEGGINIIRATRSLLAELPRDARAKLTAAQVRRTAESLLAKVKALAGTAVETAAGFQLGVGGLALIVGAIWLWGRRK